MDGIYSKKSIGYSKTDILIIGGIVNFFFLNFIIYKKLNKY